MKPFTELLAERPELQAKYSAFLQAIESNPSVPSRVLTLCRARIQQIHGLQSDDISEAQARALASSELEGFDEGEKSALIVAEKIPYQYHQLEDHEVDALKSAFGDAGCVSLLTALAFFDVAARLTTTFASEAA